MEFVRNLIKRTTIYACSSPINASRTALMLLKVDGLGRRRDTRQRDIVSLCANGKSRVRGNYFFKRRESLRKRGRKVESQLRDFALQSRVVHRALKFQLIRAARRGLPRGKFKGSLANARFPRLLHLCTARNTRDKACITSCIARTHRAPSGLGILREKIRRER